jgi:UDP-glucuronate decarboxylase
MSSAEPTRVTPRPARVLVTGGAGFLGSHLCERLLAAGHAVVCMDNFTTGAEANLVGFSQQSEFQVVRHDVACPWPTLPPVEQIYNMACPASPVHYQADPVQTWKTSVLGALYAAEAARARGIPLLQASTSEVYGDPHVHPQPERYWGHVNPIGIRACYDEGKRAAETLLFDMHRRYGLNIRVARIFNTYGPRMHARDGRVVSNFIVQALSGQPITVYGDGSQTRSFCYVDDLIDGLMGLMSASDDVTGPINLGNPTEFTVRALAEQVLALTGASSPLRREPLPPDDPRQRCPDITAAQQLLGWVPRVGLEEGLRRTVAYFESELKRSPPEGAAC